MSDLTSEIDRAIQLCVEHSSVHEEWVQHCESSGYSGEAGGVDHHLDSIVRYNFIIETLKKCASEIQRHAMKDVK